MRLNSQLGLAFFGLTPEYNESLLDEIFYLIYYMGFTYHDAYSLPIFKRRWFIKRFIKEVNPKDKDQPGPTRASHLQTPETRALTGAHRTFSPNRLNRPR